MSDNNPQQLVFIDSRVPDLQDLLDGLQPGEQAFVLDPSSDGIQQIADVLAANNLANLSSIAIVSHGNSGELELGSSFITGADLGDHSNALAEIGASLAPGGAIQLYGCDVALGSAGQQFVNDFSTLTGGAVVEASTHLVGSAADGGSWTLDASSAEPAASNGSSIAVAANGAAATPFTPAALANFQGELATPVQTEVWFVTAGIGNQQTIEFADNNNGSNTATNTHTQYAGNTHLTHLNDIALDTQDNLYFVIDSAGQGDPNVIEKGTLSQAVAGTGPNFTTLYTESLSSSQQGLIVALALDVPDQIVYFCQDDPNESSVSFDKIRFDGTGLTTLATIPSGVAFNDMTLDLATGNAYLTAISEYVGFQGTTVGANFIYDVSGITPTATSLSITQLTISPHDSGLGGNNFPLSLGVLNGIAVDKVNNILYFTADGTKSTSQGGIYFYDLSNNPTGTYGTVWSTASSLFSGFDFIEVDPATNTYYAGNRGSDNSIYVGSLTGTALQRSPTHFVSGAPTEGLALDNAPTLAVTPTTPTFTESVSNPASSNNTPVTVISGATAGDSDNTALNSATVSIGGFFAGDLLSASTAGTSIASSYNSSTGVLTLSGLDTFAHYQSVLASVHFTSTSENPTDYGSDASRTLTWSVNDGLLTSAPATATVTVVGVNDAPTLSGTTASKGYTEAAGAVTLSGAAAVGDPDSLNLASATVSVTGGTFAGDGDVLATSTAGTSITASYDSSNERLVLSGSDTLAHYQTVLDSVTFNSTSLNPTNYGSNLTRTVNWVLNDGSGSNNLSTAVTETVSITAVNNPPTLAGTAASVGFTEGTAVTLSGAVTVTDPDNLGLAGATVAIAGGTFAGDGDVLSTATVGTHITASYNSSSETLVLSGSDTLANYQAVLDRVTFSSGSNPDDYGSQHTRTVTWVLNDGSGSSNLSTAATTTVSITAINDPPVLSGVAASASFTELGTTTLSGAVTVTDPDSLKLSGATVRIVGGTFAGDGDTLATSTTGTAITASYNTATETLVLSGADTLANYQSVLDKVTFTDASHNPTNYGANPGRTLTWVLNDGSGSNNLSSVATTTLAITAVNDAPTLAGTAGSVSFTENGGAVVLSASLTASDPDNLTLAGATVRIAGGTFAGDGDLLAADTTGTAITASYNTATETLVLSGTDTPVDYQKVLDTVTFVTGSDNPTDYGSQTSRTVTWVLNDGTTTGTATTTTVNITASNDAPTLGNVAGSQTYTEGGAAAVLAAGLTLIDPDSLNMASATVAIVGGTFAADGDLLAVNVAGTAITASYSTATETLVLSGTDTAAHYQSVLDSLTFGSSSHNPTDFGSSPTRVVTWQVNDGSGTSALSNTATTTVSLTAVNDAPTLANVTGSVGFTEEAGTVVLSNAVSVTDPDNLKLAGASVSISGGAFAGDVLATSTAGTGITASYSSATHTLVLSGSDTLADYQLVLDRVSFTGGENPTDYGSDPTRLVTWVLNDGSTTSTPVTSTVGVTNVNDPPTLANVAAFATAAPGATVTLAGAVSVQDPDNLALAGATVAITGGTFGGDLDVLAATTTGTSITASYDSTSETLTLSGSDTLAHYQSVLDSVTFETGAADPTNAGADPTRTVSWVLNDGSATSAPVTSTVSLQTGPAVDPPAHVGFTEGPATVALGPALTVTDPTTTTLTSATVAITGGAFAGDQLLVAGATSGTTIAGTNITVSFTGSGPVTLTGSDTLANYQAALEAVSFASASHNPTDYGSEASRTVVWTVVDASGSTHDTGSSTTTIDITALNDAPTLSSVAPNAAFTEDGGAVTLAGALAVTDPDNLDLVGATVAVTGGFAGDGDVLAAGVGGTNITASYDSASETLVLSGSDTLANYQQVLDSVTFASGQNPDHYGSAPTRLVTFVLDDGSATNPLSAPATTTVAITAINDAPTLGNAAVTDGFTVGDSVTLAGAATVTDPDSLTLASATVAISEAGIASGTFTAGGALTGDLLSAVTAGTSITASYDSTSETLTLSGSDTLAHYQQVLDSVTFSSGPDPSNGNADPTRTVTWVLDDGGASNNLSTPVTTTVSLHLGPAIRVAASASFTEGSTTTLAPAVTLRDSNATTTLTSATVAITGGAFAGDVLSADTTGFGAITASYDTAGEVLRLSGSDTLADYQAVLDTVTFSSSSHNPSDFGSDPGRTVTWTVTDDSGGGQATGTATSSIGVTAINDAPTVAAAQSVGFTEGNTVTVSGALSLSDPDSLTLVGATVAIGGGFAGDGDVLAAATGFPGITASYSSASQTLVLTGTDTLSHYQAVLDSVTFGSGQNPDRYGSNPTRTLTWQVDDGSASSQLSNVATTTVAITALDNAPTLAGVAVTTAFTAGTTVGLSPTLSVSDPDSLTLASATVAITGGSFTGDTDVLAADTSGFPGITASYSAASQTLILTGSDTLADYQAVLDSVTFTTGPNPNNGGLNPTRTISWVVNDGSLGSNPATTTLAIAHVPPTLAGVATSVAFTQAQTVTLSGGLSVADPDSATLTGATVHIAGGFAGDGDVLAATVGATGISASYDAAGETLVLSGAHTLAQYQQVLDSVTFRSGSDPTNGGNNRTRTITWVANDGDAGNGVSSTQTTTVSITPLDAAPTLSQVAGSVGFTENGAAVTLSAGLSVSDPDSTSMKAATVAIVGGSFAGDGDLLTANTSGTSITASYDTATQTLTLSGTDTMASYRQVLDSVTFASSSHNPTDYGADPTRTITWVVNDDFSIASAAATTTVHLTAVNDAPAAASLTATAGFTEGSTLPLSPTLSVTDPDSLDLASATVHIVGGGFAGDGDVLLANVAGTHITASYDAITETLTLSGSDPLATYQAVLDSVNFASSANPDDYGSNPTRTVTWVLNDGAASNNLSTAATTTISITAINDSPALGGLPGSFGFTEGQQATLAGSASVSDPDSLDLASATVAIIGGSFAGDADVLAVGTAGTSITASYDAATETLRLTGSDTLAHYTQVLDGLTFGSGLNPDNYGSNPTRTLTWLLDDGAASNNLSTVATTTISVTPINNAPTLANVPGTATFTESGAPVTVGAPILVGDPDNLLLVGATVSIGNGFAGDGDLLAAVTTGTAITASYNSATETLVLSGTDTLADYQQVLDSVSFVTPSHNPTDYGSGLSRVLTWVANDGSASSPTGTPQFTTVVITAVNDAPSVSAAASASYTEEAAAVTLSGGAAVGDLDNLRLASATVSITGGKFAGDGDLLAAVTAGTSITASYDSSSERLTLSGSDTLAHYQSVLDSVTFAAGENPTNYGSNPTRTVTWQLNDGSGSFASSNIATTTVAVTNVNDAPTLAGVAAAAGFTENGAAVTVSPALTVSDPDNLRLASATVSIGNGFAGDGDLLTAVTAGTAITASYNAATETLTLSGSDTLAHYQSVLDSVSFSSSSHNPTNYGSNPTRLLTWVLNDGSASSSLSTAQLTTVAVTAVNDAPTLGNVAAAVALTAIGQTVTVSPAVAVSDPDNLKLASATVAIGGGTFAGDGDLLAAVITGTSITASYNAATETLTLTGSDTLAHYQSVLDSITFASGPNPTNSGNPANLTRTLTWVVNDGSASNNLSAVATTTITFQPFLGFIGVGDFDFNGRSDIAWTSNGGSHVTLWSDTAGAFTQALIPNAMAAGWTAFGVGDFNGDRKSDILWTNAGGQVSVWELSGPSLIGSGTPSNQMGAGWRVAAIGDFNGDHKSDILWVSNTGAATVWTMQGTTVAASNQLGITMPAGWSVLGTGDFNLDGRADVLWENTAGNIDIWEMSGPNVLAFVQNVGTAPAGSHLAGIGHFTAVNPSGNRGNPDIVWVDNTNHVTVWDMSSNGHIASAIQLNALDGPDWHLAAVGNFSNIPSDINSDLLWVNASTGAAHIWVVNGANVQEIPVSAPTGSALGLNNPAQSQATPAFHAAAATTTGPAAPQPQTPPPLVLASTTTPPLIGALDPQTHSLVGR